MNQPFNKILGNNFMSKIGQCMFLDLQQKLKYYMVLKNNEFHSKSKVSKERDEVKCCVIFLLCSDT